LLGGKLIIFTALGRTERAALMINEIRLAVVGPLAIGPAIHLHLEKAKVDPELQFFAAIEAGDFPDLDRAGFMRPVFQQAV
jgi:hypothetical protein